MNATTPADHLDQFFEHQAFLKNLARSLISDEHRAEDIVQDAWLVAQKRPGNPGSLRAWVAGITRNLARRSGRADRRRIRRELAAAVPEPSEFDSSTHALDTERRLRIQREVSAAVSSLKEPYRTAIFLRYFHGRSPSAMARELGVPLATVKSRLNRGLSLLRSSLESRLGEESGDWRQALVAIAYPSREAVLLSLGGLALGIKTVALAGVVVVAAAGWVFFDDEGQLPASERGSSSVESPVAEKRSTSKSEEPLRSDVAAILPDPVRPRPVKKPAPANMVSGRVVDASGIGLADVSVQRIGDESEFAVVTGPDGRFALPKPTQRIATLRAQREGLVEVMVGVYNVGGESEPLIVMAPAIRIAGRASMEGGSPSPAGVILKIKVVSPEASAAELFPVAPRPTDSLVRGSIAANISATIQEDGSFVFETAPSVGGAMIELPISEVKYSLVSPVSVPRNSSQAVDVVLRLREATPIRGETIEGRIFDDVGRGLPGASVSLGPSAVTSKSDGAFRLPRAGVAPEDYLVAYVAGRRPVVVENPYGSSEWPDQIDVVVPENEGLVLRGRVVDHEGALVEKASIQIRAEGLSHGSGGLRLGTLLAGERSHYSEDGSFEFRDLPDRRYSVEAVEMFVPDGNHAASVSGRKGTLSNLWAGEQDVELRLSPELQTTEVAGRLVSRQGMPVVGATVRPVGPGGSPKGKLAVTDSEGNFRSYLHGPTVASLVLGGEPLIGEDWPLPSGADRTSLTVPCRLRCRVELEVVNLPAEAVEVHVFDASGDALSFYRYGVHGPRNVSTSSSLWVSDGRATFSVPDSATELVLDVGPSKGLHHPLRLDPLKVNQVTIGY